MTASRSRSTAPARGGRSAGRRAGVPIEQLTAAPVVLVTGAEELLAERAVAVLTRSVRELDPEAGVERIEAGDYEPGRLAQLTGPSLFGGGTLVVAAGIEAANDAFVADARGYLESGPADGVWLVLCHRGGTRAKPLLDAARSAGAPEVVCAPITRDEDKVDFAAGEFRSHGRRASPQALRALVDAVGSDLRELAAACYQLATDTPPATPSRGSGGSDGDGRIEVDLVEELVGGRVEVTGFRVADAAVAGRADQALALLRHALATGADPVPLVAAVAAKVRAMAKVSVAGRGRSAEVAAALGLAPWQVDRARRELSGWGEDGLAAAIVALAEADTAVKGGGRDPVYAVERALLTISRARRRG